MIANFIDFARDQGGAASLLRKSIRNPSKALVSLRRMVGRDWTSLALPSGHAWKDGRAELLDSGLLETLGGELHAAFESLRGKSIRGKMIVPGHMRSLHAKMLWTILRANRPGVVVETGVCNGLSSAVILEAMHRNGHGRLISVDLPEFSDPSLNSVDVWDGKAGAVIPAGREVGWLVPADRRDRWRLELGKARDVLPGILNAAVPIDIFIHDSEHSYENQAFEFALGYSALVSGGC
jgi:hypothetical protein